MRIVAYGMTFDSAGSWSFKNDCSRNFVIFGVDNNLSSHADNHKNSFLVLSEGPTFGINGSFASSEKKFSINFSKAKTKFCLSLLIIVTPLLMGKKSLSFRAINRNANFPNQFCLGSISTEFSTGLSLEKYL